MMMLPLVGDLVCLVGFGNESVLLVGSLHLDAAIVQREDGLLLHATIGFFALPERGMSGL